MRATKALHPLAQARLARNLSQHMLADLTTLSHATIERAETGKPVRPSTRQILCEFFGIPAGELGLATTHEFSLTITGTAQEGNDMQRRYLFHLAGAIIAAPLFASAPWTTLDNAVSAMPGIDPANVIQLRLLTDCYWHLRANVTAGTLLPGVQGHLASLTRLLQHALVPSARKEVTCLLAETAQILGALAFDQDDTQMTYNAYHLSLQAATEVEVSDLHAVGLGRLALALNHVNQYTKALPCITEAQAIARTTNATIQAWLALVAAETHAHLHDPRATDCALNDASHLAERATVADTSYGIDCNVARLRSYAGTCQVRLGRYKQAIPILLQALTGVDVSAARRRSTILIALAEAHLGDHDMDGFCQVAEVAEQQFYQAQSTVNHHRLKWLIARLPAAERSFVAQRLSTVMEVV